MTTRVTWAQDYDRRDLLHQLIQRSRPVADVKRDLRSYPWASDVELVVLTREHVASALKAFLEGRCERSALE